jgi:hypothetical protein
MVFNATFNDISVISGQKTKKLHNQPWWPSSIINGPNRHNSGWEDQTVKS